MHMDILDKIRIFIFSILGLLSASCGTEEYQAVVGQVEGTVLDSQTNYPIKGCQVISNNYGTKHTDDKGHFVFENVSPGNFSLTYQCNGYETATRVVNVIAGQQVSANISLNPEEVESGIQPKQTLLDFGTRTNVLDLVLTNKSNSTQSYSITCDYNEIFFDPSQGRIVAGSDVIIKVSIDRSDLSEGHFERIFTIETAERKIDIQVVFDKGSIVRPVVKTVSLSQSADMPSRILAEGDVTVIGSSSISNHGFCYSTTTDPSLEDNEGYTEMGSMSSPSHFSGVLSDMEFDKEYLVRAYATNNEGTGYGDILRIILRQKNAYHVFTNETSDITQSSVTLTGSISGGTTADFSELGFYYGLNPNCEYKETTVKIYDNSKFGTTLNDLKEDTEYYFRAFGVFEGGEITGETKTFRTDKAIPDYGITCITSDATDILPSSATLNGGIKSDGKTKIKEWGFYYGTNANPTIRKVGMSYKVPSVLDSQAVSLSIKDLNEDTEYFYRIYLIDAENNIIQGDIKQFKTTITPSITIDSLRRYYNEELKIIEFEGKATLHPEGQTVIEAGFLYREDGYDIDYNNSYPTVYKLPCEIIDNTITGVVDVSRLRLLYVRAYMVLIDGTIIYNGKKVFVG